MKTSFRITGLAALAAGLLAAVPAVAQELTIVSAGGAWQAAQREAWYKPFAEKMGIKFNEQENSSSLALVQAMVQAHNVTLDLATVETATVLRDALRLYAFKSDKAGQFVPPYESGSVTATETVVAATGIIRAADLNLWDLAMWFNRVGSAPADSRGGREG